MRGLMKGLTRTFPACAVCVLIGRAAITGPRKDQVRMTHAVLGCTVHKKRNDSTIRLISLARFSGTM